MTATFLVTVNIPDTSTTTLTTEAEDIHDDLLSKGHDVEEVKPWARPTLVGDNAGSGATTFTMNEPPPTPPSIF